MTFVDSVDARTGARTATVHRESTADDIAHATAAAATAMPWLTQLGRVGRAELLEDLAKALDDRADPIVELADRETALGEPRLRFELARTTYQLRFMGQVAVEGSYLDASLETPGDTPAGPRPDIRRTSVPLGPVAVFGASNFPLAFSAPGGDTASALAAGCPVIVKAHSSHAGTSAAVAEAFQAVLTDWDAPTGVFQLVFGRSAGVALVNDPLIAAVGFTGSLTGGRALFDAASRRPSPVPFYGELGSVNPLVVTEAASRARPLEIGSGIAASMTQGNGQFCTKPGLFLIPAGNSGDGVVEALVATLQRVGEQFLLNDGIRESFKAGTGTLRDFSEVEILHEGPSDERRVGPLLVAVRPEDLTGKHGDALTEEYFGPFAVVVRFKSLAELRHVLELLPPALTGTLHSTGSDDPDVTSVADILAKRSGRLVFDQYPTGVSVSWGMHHGGTYPAATSTGTSVGSNAIKRWLRPISYQNAPAAVLPSELQDAGILGFPRRVDGVLNLG